MPFIINWIVFDPKKRLYSLSVRNRAAPMRRPSLTNLIKVNNRLIMLQVRISAIISIVAEVEGIFKKESA